MLVISRFYGILVVMYFNDHSPPHVHAKYAAFEASFDFAGNRLDGTMRGLENPRIASHLWSEKCFTSTQSNTCKTSTAGYLSATGRQERSTSKADFKGPSSNHCRNGTTSHVSASTLNWKLSSGPMARIWRRSSSRRCCKHGIPRPLPPPHDAALIHQALQPGEQGGAALHFIQYRAVREALQEAQKGPARQTPARRGSRGSHRACGVALILDSHRAIRALLPLCHHPPVRVGSRRRIRPRHSQPGASS